jgi:hypothetical protein
MLIQLLNYIGNGELVRICYVMTYSKKES